MMFWPLAHGNLWHCLKALASNMLVSLVGPFCINFLKLLIIIPSICTAQTLWYVLIREASVSWVIPVSCVSLFVENSFTFCGLKRFNIMKMMCVGDF